MSRFWLPPLTALLVLALPAGAQERTARRHIEAGLAAAAQGDTTAALEALARAVEIAPELAYAHYQYGRLLAWRASASEFDIRERLRAEQELLLAIDLDPRNPLYLAEYGRLAVKQRRSSDAERIIRRALSELTDGDVELRADLHYNLGYLKELEYERFRDRRMIPPTREGISTEISPNTDPWLSRYVEQFLADAPALPRSGWRIRRDMIEHYRESLRLEPTHFLASQRLLLVLLEENALHEYLSRARILTATYPARAEPYLYLGVGLHASGREDEAAVAFDSALALMPLEERAPFLDLTPLLRRKSAGVYAELDDSTRVRFDALYWRLGDPLFLTEAQEQRLEHMARVTYADLRFAAPSIGQRGWETARGLLFIRYGPPQTIASFSGCGARSSANTIVWIYNFANPVNLDLGLQVTPWAVRGTTVLEDAEPRPDLRGGSAVFMFCQNHGYLYASYAGDYQWLADELRYMQPADYRSIPSLSAFFPIPVQLARFRGTAPDEVAVEVHAELPLEQLASGLDLETGELQTGLFLVNALGEPLARDIKNEIVEYAEAASRNALRSWRLLLPAAGNLVAAVEARDAVTWRAAASRDTFSAQLFPDDTLSLSDILLADALRPLKQRPSGRNDYDIVVNPARVYARNQPVKIYYEIYGLDRDEEGFSSFDVSLAVRVESLNREGTILGGDRNPLAILGVLADAWGFSVVGDDRLELRFSREIELKGRDRANEYHSLDIGKAPPGEYEITLKVWDRLGERLAQRTRRFSVARDD